jgi:hypothetical protein
MAICFWRIFELNVSVLFGGFVELIEVILGQRKYVIAVGF